MILDNSLLFGGHPVESEPVAHGSADNSSSVRSGKNIRHFRNCVIRSTMRIPSSYNQIVFVVVYFVVYLFISSAGRKHASTLPGNTIFESQCTVY